MMHVHELAAEGFDNEQIAKALNAVGFRTPGGRGSWHAKMVTELVGSDQTQDERVAAKKQVAAERQRQRRIKQLAAKAEQRLTEHAIIMAEVTLRIHELRAQGASYRSIARTLNEECAPTLSGKGDWAASSVHRILAGQCTECPQPVTPRVPR